ncbi:regulatory protein RecX [Leeuwenhoekiella parthenopeia]|uniref:Regulatory protein RecX n=1 Tax=Leeuwenhoekiella parthenopeia TaxID=2890320 RepID=A0ABS8GPX4_9FLAO|nr:regulatory protein RecX [Leeuwenhoekiella parthenopeia]MCC4211735.1 RecX family transcriptional regulator [Leeuwenhoekiella parthenopeia]
MNQHSVKTYTVEEAKRKLEKYCAYQDRCHKEVRDKLVEMRMIPEAVDAVLYHLLQHKFLDEERFARSFARGKFRHKKWGKNRIKQELKQREIGDYLIKKAFTEIPDSDYLNTFDELAQKRFDQLTGETDKYKKRKKLADYLAYRGWPGDWIYEKAKELIP